MKSIPLIRCAAIICLFPGMLRAVEPITNSLGMKLVPIPAGEFPMGADEAPSDTIRHFSYATAKSLEGETPRHRVRITKPFFMGAHETRVKDFLRFYHDAKYQTETERDVKPSWGYDSTGTVIESTNLRPWAPEWEQTQDHPVNYVSWNDAVAFCKWLSRKEGKTYRLPTEAEWEYACRAGTTTRYWSGNDPESLIGVANVAEQDLQNRWPHAVIAKFDSAGVRTDQTLPFPFLPRRDGFVFTAPVAQFQANAFGLFDMHSNVWEWCSDRYDPEYYSQSPAADPKGPAAGSFRVLRGGGWYTAPVSIRSARRGADAPAYRSNSLGFRVVREVE